MQVKQDDVGKKVKYIAEFFNDPQDAEYYHPQPAQRLLAYVVHNGRIRNNWDRRASHVARELRNLAGQVDSKKADNFMLNYLTIMRVAHLLDGYNGGELEITGGSLDQQYWNENEIPLDAIQRDYAAVKKGKYAVHTAELYQEGSPQPAQQPQPAAAPTPQAAPSPIVQDGGRELPRGLVYLGAILIGLIIAFIGLQFFGDDLVSLVLGDQSGVPQMNEPGMDLTQPDATQPPVLPDEPGRFGQALQEAMRDAGVTSVPGAGNRTEGISTPLVSIQQSLLLGVALLSQVTFWILVLLSIALAYQVFKDARARASEGDFSAFLRLMFLITILAVLPIRAIIQLDLTIWRWYFPMPTSYHLILLLVAGSGLWGIAQDRMTEELDLTPLSAGLFIAGIIFFASNAVAFLSWQVPIETYIAWGSALIVHLVEMVRQEDTKEALLLTGAGILIQLVTFFGLAWALETTASPFFVQYGQEVAFLFSIMLSVGVISFLLNLLSEQNLLPAGGEFLPFIETSSHDAGLLLIMWAVIFMSQYWV